MTGPVHMIAEVPKSRNDVLRVTREIDRRGDVIKIRAWFVSKANGGELLPGKEGLSIAADKLEALIDALRSAQEAGR